jgi:ribosomal protein RSM22 (predicted rRNA methylase)
MQEPSWCHFAQRLPRTKAHRDLKGAELGYEDEKFSYVALTRRAVTDRASRIVDHPHYRKHLVELSLCTRDGLRKRTVPRSDPSYKVARKAAWGDGFNG